MRSEGIPFLFLTNNSEQTPLDLARKLAGMGIHGLTQANFITAAIATAQFLHAQSPHSTAYVMGGSGLAAAMYKVGLLDHREPSRLRRGRQDLELQLPTMRKAAQLIDGGAKFIGTNPDMIDPVEGGTEPAAGASWPRSRPLRVGRPTSSASPTH